LIKLRDNNTNTPEAWNNLYLEDTSIHDWGGTWKFIKPLLPNKGPILDYGCGMAFFLESLHNQGYNISGYERSQVACDTVLNRNPALRVAWDIPILPRMFNTVICLEVIEHMENPQSFARYLLDLVTDRLIVTTPADGDSPYHLWMFEEDDFINFFKGYKVEQTVLTPPWGNKKRIIVVSKEK